jgi:hypothetical protein
MTKEKALFDNTKEGFEVWKKSKVDGKLFLYADFPLWSEWWSNVWGDNNFDNEIASLVRRGNDFFIITESINGNFREEKIEKPFQIRL